MTSPAPPWPERWRNALATILSSAAICSVGSAAADSYAERDEVRDFVADVAQRHGFEPAALLAQFRSATFQPKVLRAIMPPSDPRIRSWRAYRARYLDAARIDGGLLFWARHGAALEKAQAQFGVPPEIIVAIIGVETIYGRVTGDFQTLSALATLAFDYPPRAQLFRAELEQLLLLARERQQAADAFHGSYAGALGLPQFLPSSYRRYAIDFDADGRTDLGDSPADAIGSVAHFLQQHGWNNGGRIAVPARVAADHTPALADGSVQPKYSSTELAQHGVTAAVPMEVEERSALIDLVSPDAPTEYWLGFDNFYVLTRYNRSSFYAMAVFQLAETLRAGRQARMSRR